MSMLRACLIAALAGVLAACQSASGPFGARPDAGTLSRVLESGELRVGLSGNQPPLNMRNVRGEMIGLEVDLVRALAHSMGLEARFVQKPFGELLPALEGGEVDLVISGMTITPERNARAAFVGPYFVSGKSVLARRDKLDRVDDVRVLDDPARRYAVLAGSTSEALVRSLLPKATLVPTPDYDTAVRMVIDGEVDALVADFPICAITVMRHPEEGLATLATPFTIEPLGIALPPGDPLFVNLVENYLRTLEETGLLTQLKARWFSEGDWLDELP